MEILFMVLKIYSILIMGVMLGVGLNGIATNKFTSDVKSTLQTLALFIPVIITLILA